MVLQADTVEYDAETETVSALGHVEIADQGRILLADRVTYDQRNDRITASGNVQPDRRTRQCRLRQFWWC